MILCEISFFSKVLNRKTLSCTLYFYRWFFVSFSRYNIKKTLFFLAMSLGVYYFVEQETDRLSQMKGLILGKLTAN